MLDNLKKDVKKVSNPKKAEFVARYFKTGKGEYGEGDVFVGVTVPDCRTIAQKYRDLQISELELLLHSKIHEERLIALMILVIQFESCLEIDKERIFKFYLKNTKYVNNWDLVDSSADHIVGGYLMSLRAQRGNLKPKEIASSSSTPRNDVLFKLARSKNIWERRIAIIATYTFIKQNQFDETLKISEMLLTDTHDLIHKAVGWMLREIGKKDKKVLEHFLRIHKGKIPRTTLRYAIERFPQDVRIVHLSGNIP